jgi:hypothetical protein
MRMVLGLDRGGWRDFGNCARIKRELRMRAKCALRSLSLSQGMLRGLARLAQILRETKNVSLGMTTTLRGLFEDAVV